MIDKIILSAVLGTVGFNGLFPDPPVPLTLQQKAKEASQILFGRGTSEAFQKLTPETFLELFEGVPQAEIERSKIKDGIDIIDALSRLSSFLSSNGEARRALKENSISVNKLKVTQDFIITEKELIADKYVLLQRGKKNYFILNIII